MRNEMLAEAHKTHWAGDLIQIHLVFMFHQYLVLPFTLNLNEGPRNFPYMFRKIVLIVIWP